jgi:hypothetical protein
MTICDLVQSLLLQIQLQDHKSFVFILRLLQQRVLFNNTFVSPSELQLMCSMLENWVLFLIHLNTPLANQFVESILQSGLIYIDFQNSIVLRTLLMTRNYLQLSTMLTNPNISLENKTRILVTAYELNCLDELITKVFFNPFEIIHNSLKVSGNISLNLTLHVILSRVSTYNAKNGLL